MERSCKELKYPVGIQSFAELRKGGYVYVDKTPYIHRLFSEGKYYFLSRPRRFGKSLLLSTIEAYYRGRRDLFEGLALNLLTDDWEPHPILHIDLNTSEYSAYEHVVNILDHYLSRWESEWNLAKNSNELSLRFSDVIRSIHEKSGKKVVILIDEYDKPMLGAIDDEALAGRFRSTLKAFYGNLKSMDEHIEFAMLTGVARFSMVSIFSDLNNLRDISFEHKFAGICGITNDEIDEYFTDGLQCLAESYHKSYEEIREELKTRYDGYHFSEDLLDIYNPFSLVNVFASEKFRSYWFNSGTPSYLVSLLKNYDWRLSDINGYRIKPSRLVSEGIMTKEAIPSLYQSGYLTIKDYDSTFDEFILGYPNQEVEEGFIEFLMPIYLGSQTDNTEFTPRMFVSDVVNGEIKSFMTRFDSLLRGMPHISKNEPHEVSFQNAIYLVFTMMGFYTRVEDHTSNGRIDLMVETDKYVYIFEFKVKSSAAEAMAQIKQKKYWKKYEAKDKQIYLIAANFSPIEHALDDIMIEQP